jgi:hypothetical protein
MMAVRALDVARWRLCVLGFTPVTEMVPERGWEG